MQVQQNSDNGSLRFILGFFLCFVFTYLGAEIAFLDKRDPWWGGVVGCLLGILCAIGVARIVSNSSDSEESPPGSKEDEPLENTQP